MNRLFFQAAAPAGARVLFEGKLPLAKTNAHRGFPENLNHWADLTTLPHSFRQKEKGDHV